MAFSWIPTYFQLQTSNIALRPNHNKFSHLSLNTLANSPSPINFALDTLPLHIVAVNVGENLTDYPKKVLANNIL